MRLHNMRNACLIDPLNDGFILTTNAYGKANDKAKAEAEAEAR